MRATSLPTGTVTFLFTDMEGSTRLLKRLGESYGEFLAEHRRIIRAAGRDITERRSATYRGTQRADVLGVSRSPLAESELDPVSVANLAQRLESLERSSAENRAILAERLEIVRAGSQRSRGEQG
jgi:hypothetical protein